MGWHKQIKAFLKTASSPSKRSKRDIKLHQCKGKYKLRRGQKSKVILTGKHSYGLGNIKIRSWGEGANLYVGGFCSIAGDVTVFLGGNHRTDWATTFPFGHIVNNLFPNGQINGGGHPATKGHVVIENDVWVGQGCTIMSGLRIGSGSVLAANSVVVKDVEPYTIVCGNPAKPLKKRFPRPIVQQLLKIKWWNRSDEEINQIVPLLQQPLTEKTLKEIIATLNGIQRSPFATSN
jgi:acetyltransferase-like isoleucine patch superfamily enzyme